MRILDVLSSYRDKATNVLYSSLGDSENNDEEMSDAISGFGGYGFLGIPETGDEAMVSEENDTTVVVGYRSLKLMDVLGKLMPGEVCVANAFGCRVVLKKSKEISIITTKTDNSMVVFSVGPTGIDFSMDSHRIMLQDNVFQWIMHGDPVIRIGRMAGLPAPLDFAQSFITINADIIHLKGKIVKLGDASVFMNCAGVSPVAVPPVPIPSSVLIPAV